MLPGFGREVSACETGAGASLQWYADGVEQLRIRRSPCSVRAGGRREPRSEVRPRLCVMQHAASAGTIKRRLLSEVAIGTGSREAIRDGPKPIDKTRGDINMSRVTRSLLTSIAGVSL